MRAVTGLIEEPGALVANSPRSSYLYRFIGFFFRPPQDPRGGRGNRF